MLPSVKKKTGLSAHGQVFQYYGTFTWTFLSMFEARVVGLEGPGGWMIWIYLDPVARQTWVT
jgi:hypothetical protein